MQRFISPEIDIEFIVTSGPGYVYWKNMDSVYFGCNQNFATLIGLEKPSDIIGLHESKMPWAKMFPSTVTYNINADKQVMLTQEKVITEECLGILNEKGVPIILRSEKLPLIDKHGNIAGILGISVDVTETKEKYLMHKNFGEMAAEVAHDLGSPLNAMNVAIASLRQANIACDDVALLERAMQSVKDITSNLLTRYRNLDNNAIQESALIYDDGNISRYIILSTLLENIVANKRIEWSANPCNISYNVDIDILGWLYVTPIQLSRVISNLLNNSYESMNKETREISIRLSIKDNQFNLLITDNGCGILPEQISKVLSGKSLKHIGNGLGLSGAKRYFESLNGTLNLTSIYGENTEINIIIPISNTPKWFNNEIAYNNQTTFAVLDDDPSIIMLWQRIFTRLNIKCQYFTNISEFRLWYMPNKHNNVILLIDYDIQDAATGLDIIKECSPINAYLVTSHAEDVWLQNIVSNSEEIIKLVPKSLIDCIRFVRA